MMIIEEESIKTNEMLEKTAEIALFLENIWFSRMLTLRQFLMYVIHCSSIVS